ncbi:MAG: hypothetical protein V7L23_32525, partial [Nostoc sp.]|uniref:hypothetical protein n=1 Tax=Nostoc sp. TaxID=1180 RepID=UPI002FF16A6B
MSQGFESKSADALQNSRGQRKSKEIADIGSIQQSLAACRRTPFSETVKIPMHLNSCQELSKRLT